MRRNPVLPGLVIVLTIGFIALPALAATATVDIWGGAYHPASLTVEENTTVTWTNYDTVSHTVTSAGGFFDSGPMEQNETFEYTFTETGTYPYGCTLNASKQRVPMQGVVIVVPEGTVIAPTDNVSSGEEPTNVTVADVIARDENLTAFTEAVEVAGLVQTVLAVGGPYTVFAPNDAAFEAFDNETLAALINDTEMLDTLLMYHVVEGDYTAEDLAAAVNITGNETVLSTLSGDTLSISMENGTLLVENATIVTSDIMADNGVVHIIDRVLVPPGSGIGEAPENVTTETAPENVTTEVIPENVTTETAPENVTTEVILDERVIP
ncbi:MAG: fasciclin domain-containing protein [Candidatus Methanoculleus thermohydrogenotrophicum]